MMGVAATIGTIATVASAGMSIYNGLNTPSGSSLQNTAEGKQAANMAIDQYNTYLQDFKPTEQAFISDVMSPSKTAVREGQQTGKVNADVAQASAIPAGDPNRVLRQPGAFTKTADTLGAAQNNAVMAVQNKQLQGEQAIAQIGEGKASNADLSMSNLAQSAEQQAIGDAQMKQQSQGSVANSIGSAGGALAALGKNWPSSSSAALPDVPDIQLPETDVTPVSYPGESFGFSAPTLDI